MQIYYLNQPDLTTYISDVSLGSTGSEAKRVENRLASLGYLDATPDEEYDEYAVEALELFQETAAISITDVADRITSDQLFSSTAPAADRCVLHEIAKGEASCTNSCEAVIELLCRTEPLHFQRVAMTTSLKTAPRSYFFESCGRELEIRLWLIDIVQDIGRCRATKLSEWMCWRGCARR